MWINWGGGESQIFLGENKCQNIATGNIVMTFENVIEKKKTNFGVIVPFFPSNWNKITKIKTICTSLKQ